MTPPPKKRVRFSNTITTVREIERVGKSEKLEPRSRKFIPADMKKMKAKHNAAVERVGNS